MNTPNQKPQLKKTAAPVANTAPKTNPAKPSQGTPAKSDPGPMHAAKGNDDTMSQPQASKTPAPNGKKPS